MPATDTSLQATDCYQIPRRLVHGSLVTLVGVTLLLIVGHPLWLRLLARALIVSAPPQRADAIVILGGGTGDREATAARYYQAGYAARLYTAGGEVGLVSLDGVTFADLSARELNRLGVPAEAVEQLGEAHNTCAEAAAVRTAVQGTGARRILLVSDPFHMRRATLIFDRVLAGSGIEVVPIAADPSWFEVDRWWTQQLALNAISAEYLKFAYFVLAGC